MYTSPQGTVSYTGTVNYIVRWDLRYLKCMCCKYFLSLSLLKTRLAGLGCQEHSFRMMRALPGNTSGRIRACASRAHRVCGAASHDLLCKWAPWPSAPVPTTREARDGSLPEVSASQKAKAWHLSPPAARSWPPTTTTGATWVPLPVTGPVEVLSTLGKPSPTPSSTQA